MAGSKTAPIDIPRQGEEDVLQKLVARKKCPAYVICSHSILNEDFIFDLNQYYKLPRTDKPTVWRVNCEGDAVQVPQSQHKTTQGFRLSHMG